MSDAEIRDRLAELRRKWAADNQAEYQRRLREQGRDSADYFWHAIGMAELAGDEAYREAAGEPPPGATANPLAN